MALVTTSSPASRKGTTAFAWLSLLALLACGSLPVGNAAELYSESSVKAVYLYRFAGYVEWPPETPAHTRFTIAVMGDDQVAEALSRLLPQHSIRGQPAEVRVAHRVADLAGAQMIYVGENHRGDLRDALAAVEHRPVLVVTGETDGLAAGSVVNFVQDDNKIRFEISLDAATRVGLKISSQLLALAVRIQHG